MRVLLIEDEPALADFRERVLPGHGQPWANPLA